MMWAGGLVTAASAGAQAVTSLGGPSIDPRVLLRTAGPSFDSTQSPHFTIYTEHGDRRSAGVADSLEAAWAHAVALLGMPVPDSPRVSVFVTASRTRFPLLLSPQNRGLTTGVASGPQVVILVHNDSVRLYARHEVMHAVARRAFGVPNRSSVWLVEGLATYADGRCQSASIAAVARDLLAEMPDLTANELITDFERMAARDRH